ncbi:MAG: type II toxin-antitoxin system prevent-host-death family antitoxin [Bryobacteraceae bacterium]
MATVTAFEAKTRFGEILERAANGEEIVITRYDKPVARLIPQGNDKVAQTRAALLGLRALGESMSNQGFKPLTQREIRTAINEGRK